MVYHEIIAKGGYYDTFKVWMGETGNRGVLIKGRIGPLVWFGSQETEDKPYLVHKGREQKI